MSWKKVLALMAFCFALVFVDAVLKLYIHTQIPISPWGGIGVFHMLGIDCSLEHVRNTGAAWGMFSSMQSYLLFFRILMVGGMIGYLFFFKCPSLRQFPLMAIIAGAIGNILDFFLYGHVIDMFHFIFWGYSFPVFNIADSAIFCGIVAIFLQNLYLKRKAALPKLS